MARGFDLILVGLLIIVVPFGILFFLALGPVGWLLVGGAFIVAGIVVTVLGDGEDESSTSIERVNCSECGARNEAQRERCEYCGAELPSSHD